VSDHLGFIASQKLFALPNVETSTKCSLRCSQCTRAKLQEPEDSKKYKEIKTRINSGFDLPLRDAEKLLKFFDVGIMFCGQLSDPIFWPSLFDFLELSKTYPTKTIVIATAASQKNIEWYRKGFEISHNKVKWIFGLDGMQDTSAIYRVGQNSALLFDAMVLGRALGVHIEWNYIVFEHNIHQLEQAKEFAKTHGIVLNLVKSNRTGGNVIVPSDWKPERNKETMYDIV